MSKPVKALLRKELVRRLAGTDSLAVVSLMGIDGLTTNRLRRELRSKDIRVTVVKNSVAREALKEMGLEPASVLLEGPCAIATGADSVVTVVREVLGRSKGIPALAVKGAVLEGEVFLRQRVDELSKYPTRGEGLSRVVALACSPGGRLAACLAGPGGVLADIIKAVEEQARTREQPAQPEKTPEAPAPAGEASAPSPAVEAPAPSPAVEASAPSPAVDASAPSPAVDASAPSPAGEGPAAAAGQPEAPQQPQEEGKPQGA
jgi:large subunit ribosomal protein L10